MTAAIDRPDARFAVVGVHSTTPDRQLATADSLVARWENSARPEGLLSRTCYVSVDGTAVLTYEQSTVEPAGDHYRIYQSNRFDDGPAEIFSVSMLEAPPGWIDTVLRLEAEAGVPSGCLAGHVHTGADDTKLLNISEWSSLAELEDFLGSGALDEVFATAGLPRARLFGTNNYRPHRGPDRST